MSDIVERLNEAAADERKRLHDLGIGLGVHGDVLYGTAAATIRDLQAKIQDLEKGWMPVSEFKDEHCRKPCWTWGPKRVAPTIALGDFADGLWFHEVRSGTAPWSHWSDIDEDEPLIDNDGFSSITHFMLLSIPPPPVTDEGK